MILIGCADQTTYYSAKSVVVDNKAHHWGKGFYKHEIYYKYFDGSDTVVRHSTAEGTVRGWTAKYTIGDSLLIGYNPKDSSDTFISKRIYAKPRMGK